MMEKHHRYLNLVPSILTQTLVNVDVENHLVPVYKIVKIFVLKI